MQINLKLNPRDFRAVYVGIAFCAALATAQDQQHAGLSLSVPELQALRPESDPAAAAKLLGMAAKAVDGMIEDMVDVSAAEAVTDLRFSAADLQWERQQAQFRYVVEWPLHEFRTGKGPDGFVAPSGFVEMLNCLSTKGQKVFQFRALGHSGSPEGERTVFAYEGARERGAIWLDSDQGTARRIRAERTADDGTVIITDIEFSPVRFNAVETTSWLPVSAVVEADVVAGRFRSVHRFSDYHLFGIDDADDAEQKKANAGVAGGWKVRAEDAIELLAKATAAEDAQLKAGLLAESLRLEPQRPETHFQMGIALWRKQQPAEAEVELRGVVKEAPSAASAHNLLGIVLFQKGDTAGAITAFRASISLRPTGAATHFNLAEALEKSGDMKSALEEYRSAASLAPESKEFAARLEARSRPVEVKAPVEFIGEPIRVEVRQVLVPVVVTRDGHSLSGLKREDFHVYEDGVEQKIASFTVEQSGTPDAGTATPSAAIPQASAAPGPVAAMPARASVRRTYVVCVDALHTSFSNLVYVRNALTKLFRQEREGDSQYMVMTIGTSPTILQNVTRDPAAVLAAVDGQSLSKAYMASRHGAGLSLDDYRRDLTRVRAACDRALKGDVTARAECDSGKATLPGVAAQMAEFDRVGTTGFLRQLRSIVQQLAPHTDRRAIVLVSDGFSMVPGEAAYKLLSVYFPEIREAGLRGVERIQDELEPILKVAQQKNIPIYTIDSRGLYTQPIYSASDVGGTGSLLPSIGATLNQVMTSAGETLTQIAADTGGTAYRNSNDLAIGMARAFADGRDYYLLSYVPSNGGTENKFRSISIRVSDKKAGVLAKKGYWPDRN